MQTGTKISAAAHVTLIGWALFGGVFRSDPLPFEVQQVSVISGEEFAALSAPKEAPEVVTQPESPEPPDPIEEPVTVPEADTPDPVPEAPQSVEQPDPEPLPEPVVEAPEPDLPTETPVLEPPQPDVVALPEPPGVRPKSRPVDRVAPQPVAPPPPDAAPDEIEREAVTAEEGTDTPREEQDATAPEEATDRIVTEADEASETAPTRSPRPPARRPQAPKPPVETAQPTTDSNAVNDALQEALANESTAPAPTGPPLSSGEKEALRVAVSNCWNVGSLSTEALATTVVVGVSMAQDGKPDTGSIRLIDSSGGSNAAAQQAFGAARRAIIRCGSRGYALPAEKYDQWREIEMTFNPERMRIK